MVTVPLVQLATASVLFAGVFRRIGRHPVPVALIALAVLGLGIWIGYSLGWRRAMARHRDGL